MFSEIGSALASIKTFSDFTALVLQTKVTAAIREKAIESQAAIISVQTAMLMLQTQYQSLLSEKAELEKHLVQIEDWKTKASKYFLKAVDPGIFVYAFNPEVDNTTPEHWLCAHCYEKNESSILERTASDGRGVVFLCFRCQNSIRTSTMPGEVA